MLSRRHFLKVSTVAAAGLWIGEARGADWNLAPPARADVFVGNAHAEVSGDFLIVTSNGIPNHPTGVFPNPTNPNTIREQNYLFKIPLQPRFSDQPVKLPFGPIGVAVNGIPFYNPYNAEGRDAVMGPHAEVFDSCCGHPDPMGRYHYHKYPVCVHNPFPEMPGDHSPLIGYAFDGFGVYGPNSAGGTPPTDLDSCNGHSDAERGYHYHVTAHFPYILGAYRGVPEASDIDHARGGGRQPGWGPPPGGPPGDPDMPPPPPPMEG